MEGTREWTSWWTTGDSPDPKHRGQLWFSVLNEFCCCLVVASKKIHFINTWKVQSNTSPCTTRPPIVPVALPMVKVGRFTQLMVERGQRRYLLDQCSQRGRSMLDSQRILLLWHRMHLYAEQRPMRTKCQQNWAERRNEQHRHTDSFTDPLFLGYFGVSCVVDVMKIITVNQLRLHKVTNAFEVSRWSNGMYVI